MNVELLLKVKAAVLEEPKRLNIWKWQYKAYGPDAPLCGTVGCIAGWADLLSRTDGSVHAIRDTDAIHDVARSGREALWLNCAQASALFESWGWPYDLRNKLDATERQTTEHARVVAEAIDRFIADPSMFTRRESTV